MPTQQNDAGLSDLIEVVKSKKKESGKDQIGKAEETIENAAEHYVNEKIPEPDNSLDENEGWQIDDDILDTNLENEKTEIEHESKPEIEIIKKDEVFTLLKIISKA